MAYKFNPLTGKMDLVNSAAEISADLAITGETFEKHGNLEPQVLDHVPVNEVMSDILFRTYAPKVTADAGNNQNAYHGETIAIKPGWTVEKQSNNLDFLRVVCAALGTLDDIDLTQNAETKISQDGAAITVYATVSDVAGSNGKKKKVVLSGASGANLSFETKTTIKATAYDSAENASSEATSSINFHYPIIVGSINDMSVKAVTLKKDGTNWVFDDVILGNDTETSDFSFVQKGRDGSKSFSIEIGPYSANTPFYPIVLVQNGLKVDGVAEVSGQTETPITPGFVADAVNATFKIADVTKWSNVEYDKYMLVRSGSPATADKIVYKISITTKQ